MDPSEAELREALTDPAGRIPRALEVVVELVGWAEHGRELDLADVVTGESVDYWTRHDLAGVLEGLGYGTAGTINYPTPGWAVVPMFPEPDGEAWTPEERQTLGYASAFFVRWEERLADWRVHVFGPAGRLYDELGLPRPGM